MRGNSKHVEPSIWKFRSRFSRSRKKSIHQGMTYQAVWLRIQGNISTATLVVGLSVTWLGKSSTMAHVFRSSPRAGTIAVCKTLASWDSHTCSKDFFLSLHEFIKHSPVCRRGKISHRCPNFLDFENRVNM